MIRLLTDLTNRYTSTKKNYSVTGTSPVVPDPPPVTTDSKNLIQARCERILIHELQVGNPNNDLNLPSLTNDWGKASEK